MLAFYPFRYVFEFDPDEGINLMKALLQLKGYSLYFDIYSDQPPLFTFFLTGLFWLIEPNVTLARLGVLAFSLLLVGSAVWILQMEWGVSHAILATAFLALAPFYPILSVSVMIGLPAIALSFLSFALAARWAVSNEVLSLLFSALLFAAAILTKAFVAPFGPIIAAAVLLRFGRGDPRGHQGQFSLSPFVLWTGVAAAVLLVAAVLIGPQNWHQLVASHLQSDHLIEFINRKGINDYLAYGWGIVFLGLLGAGYSLVRKRWITLALFAWGGINYLLLTQTNPVWYHHSLLVTVPAALLASLPTGDALSRIGEALQNRRLLDRGTVLSVAVLLLVGWVLSTRIPATATEFDLALPNIVRGPDPESLDFIHFAEMSELRGQDDVIVTDRPMFAFRMGKIVPPNLAVWSNKRTETGALTESQVIDEIEKWEPTQVLIGRYVVPEIEAYLQRDYVREYHYGDFRLFQRK